MKSNCTFLVSVMDSSSDGVCEKNCCWWKSSSFTRRKLTRNRRANFLCVTNCAWKVAGLVEEVKKTTSTNDVSQLTASQTVDASLIMHNIQRIMQVRCNRAFAQLTWIWMEISYSLKFFLAVVEPARIFSKMKLVVFSVRVYCLCKSACNCM